MNNKKQVVFDTTKIRKGDNKMEKECIAFQFRDSKEAKQHMNYDIVKDYDDQFISALV